MEEKNKEEFKKNENETATRSSIRTYERDVAEALRERNGSLGSVFLAEQKKKLEGVDPHEVKEKKLRPVYILSSILLFVIAAGVFYGVYNYFDRDLLTQERPTIYNSAVVSEVTVIIKTEGLSAEEVINKLGELRENSKETVGSIVSIILTTGEGEEEKEVSIEDIPEKTGFRMPGKLSRSLEDKYAFGVHAFSRNEPFIVFTISSYEQAFAGMLEWERVLLEDLVPFFATSSISTISNEPEIVSPSASTTQSSSTSTPSVIEVKNPDAIFVDAVIKNKDVRVLKKGEEILLIYSFVDRQTLVITTNENTFKDVISHLSPDRF